MFDTDDLVFFSDGEQTLEGRVSRRTLMFAPKLYWTVFVGDSLYYVAESDLELIERAIRA